MGMSELPDPRTVYLTTMPWDLPSPLLSETLSNLYKAITVAVEPKKILSPRCSDNHGTLVLEWDRSPHHMLLEVDPNGYLSWVYRNYDSELFVSKTDDFPVSYKSAGVIRDFLLSFSS